MTHQISIVGLDGSLSDQSTSLQALQIALAGAEATGAAVTMLDTKELDLPMYAPDLPAPPEALRLAELISQTDGLIWSSPIYHGTISGSCKNALD
ncbi:MAG: NAD(P)H-dependent oxidoreductase [Candidatus Sericytochromatia bacterium]|nr:NAD(P)H-dependent oxidoreductase [Candidatus Sericytochromatia bacterium]